MRRRKVLRTPLVSVTPCQAADATAAIRDGVARVAYHQLARPAQRGRDKGNPPYPRGGGQAGLG